MGNLVTRLGEWYDSLPMNALLRGMAAYIGIGLAIFALLFVIPKEDEWVCYLVFFGGLLVLNRTIGQEKT